MKGIAVIMDENIGIIKTEKTFSFIIDGAITIPMSNTPKSRWIAMEILRCPEKSSIAIKHEADLKFP